MTAGRPKITTADFVEDWQDKILAEMSMGASRLEIYVGILDISDMTFARLMREDKQFAGTIKKGEHLSQIWWEKQGRTELKGKDFNATLWYMNMKNRFDWADKKEIKQQVSGQLDTGVANPELAAKFAEFLKGQ